MLRSEFMREFMGRLDRQGRDVNRDREPEAGRSAERRIYPAGV